jgi:hypothetical protein
MPLTDRQHCSQKAFSPVLFQHTLVDIFYGWKIRKATKVTFENFWMGLV